LLVGNAAITAEETGANTHEPIPLKNGAPATQFTQPAQPTRGTITEQQLADLKACREELQVPLEAWRDQVLAKRGATSAVELSTEKAAELISALRMKINVRQMQEGLAEKDREQATARNSDLTVSMDAVGKGKEVSTAGPAEKSGKR
jgi:hypothetical protein